MDAPTVAAVVAVTASGCAATIEPRASVGFGFEDVIGDTDWAAIDDRLDEAGVDAVTIGVGRVDRLAFVPESAGSPSIVAESAPDDLLAAAIDAVSTDADGEHSERSVSVARARARRTAQHRAVLRRPEARGGARS